MIKINNNPCKSTVRCTINHSIIFIWSPHCTASAGDGIQNISFGDGAAVLPLVRSQPNHGVLCPMSLLDKCFYNPSQSRTLILVAAFIVCTACVRLRKRDVNVAQLIYLLLQFSHKQESFPPLFITAWWSAYKI